MHGTPSQALGHRRFCCSHLQCFCKVVLVLKELLCTNIVVLFVHSLRRGRDGPCSGDSGPIYILQSHAGYFPGLVDGGGYERGLYRLLASAGDTLTLNPGSGGPAAAGCCTPRRDGQGRRGHTTRRAGPSTQGWACSPICIDCFLLTISPP